LAAVTSMLDYLFSVGATVVGGLYTWSECLCMLLLCEMFLFSFTKLVVWGTIVKFQLF